MHIVRTKAELKEAVKRYHQEGQTIGFVPTMGALHKGHTSLIETAKSHADVVVASVFVNPTQFAPHEDFDSYPRDELADLEILEEHKVSLAYLPTVEEIYPEGNITSILLDEKVSKILCGKRRPHFFDGVATVVVRLFNQVTPDVAVFGEKDFQQLSILKQVVNDLDMPVKVIGSPTVREDDGLAMSSRNRYLSAADRELAPKLYHLMKEVADGDATIEEAKSALYHSGFDVDYLEARSAVTLEPCELNDSNARLFAAAILGKTRLIDNIAL